MTVALLGLTFIVPLLLALLLSAKVGVRRVARVLAPWAAAPALALALLAPTDTLVRVPVLLGMRLGLTQTTWWFLLFTAVLWLTAGLFAHGYLAKDPAANRFFAFFLLAMIGNLGVVLARDLVTFYLMFAAMSFASYPLVAHEGTERALRAARVYLVLVLIGEAFLLTAFLLVAAAAGGYDLADLPAAVAASPRRDLIIALVLAGFGIKAGAIPLHVWLPLAHPAAPTPASAVLSGSMIKAGLLGWLLFLPLGAAAFPGWGSLCIAGGLIAAFYGVGVGLTQVNPKTILAYSSISQMGLMAVGVGIALLEPGILAIVIATTVFFAVHHAFAKAAVFLGVGVFAHSHGRAERRWVMLGLLLPCLALAGAPLASGAVAKAYLKGITAATSWPTWLEWLLQLSSVATALLMGKFLFAVWSSARPSGVRLSAWEWVPWAALLLVVGAWVWVFTHPPALSGASTVVVSFQGSWPTVVGVLLALGFWRFRARPIAGEGATIPEGDLLVPITWVLTGVRRHAPLTWLHEDPLRPPARRPHPYRAVPLPSAVAAELRLRDWTLAGTLFVLLATALIAMVLLR